MNRWVMLVLWLANAVLAVQGCGGGGKTNTPVNDAEFEVLPDTKTQDTAAEMPKFDSFGELDLMAGDAFEYIPQPGEFGYECDDNLDCDSGYCVPTPQGGRCSKQCLDDCPPGWICTKAATSPDVIYICIPRYVNICNPCKTNSDCVPDGYEGASLDLCLSTGSDGSFCAADCSVDASTCPEGYVCDEVTTPGGVFNQCVPVSGTCTCSQLAIQKGAVTECFVENDIGKCVGTRSCSIEGLSECDAATPAVEKCDDVDNDCDSFIDEGCDDDDDGWCDATIQTVGNPSLCASGGGDCDDTDKDIYPNANELCDKKDNNCDGIKDEGLCDDNDPCTDDLCDPILGCSKAFNEAPCSDGSECTENDHCFQGICQGAQKGCDDLNPCTDNLCNPLQPGGCYWPANSNPCADEGNPCTQDICENTTCQHKLLTDHPCDDGNPCTVGDICNSGICLGGPPKDCDDDEACTNDYCDLEQGCINQVLFGQACTYDVLDLGICKVPGSCGTNGCKPTPTCNCPNCALCICCSGFQFCVDSVFGGS